MSGAAMIKRWRGRRRVVRYMRSLGYSRREIEALTSSYHGPPQ